MVLSCIHFSIKNNFVYSNYSKPLLSKQAATLLNNMLQLDKERKASYNTGQVFSFGPGLISNGTITVSKNTEVDQARTSNPRTTIGQIEGLHYIIIVSDGRTDVSEGLTLLQMAEFMQSLGVKTAYNLDGGGSSTMYFDGKVINQPTSDGRRIKERSVSDIVCLGE